ncbi:hypothetical protein JX266_011063 [Neoarthrinium moseri]|nr:hypothetical protein JX266_011063 [Neoarthrinium moseri]
MIRGRYLYLLVPGYGPDLDGDGGSTWQQHELGPRNLEKPMAWLAPMARQLPSERSCKREKPTASPGTNSENPGVRPPGPTVQVVQTDQGSINSQGCLAPGDPPRAVQSAAAVPGRTWRVVPKGCQSPLQAPHRQPSSGHAAHAIFTNRAPRPLAHRCHPVQSFTGDPQQTHALLDHRLPI